MTVHTREGVVPWPEELAARYRELGYWDGVPLGRRFAESAARHPDSVAVVDGDLRLTYRELESRVRAASARLAGLGLEPDDRMLVQLPSSWQFVALTLACLHRGVVPVMALAAHRRHEITHVAAVSETVAIAVPDRLKSFDHQALASAVADETPSLRTVLVVGSAHPGNVSLDDLLAPATTDSGHLRAVEADGASVAVLLLSGGTTGLPKLIPRTHDDYSYCSRRMAEIAEVSTRTVYLVTLPPGHNFPLTGILGTLFAGGTVVMLASPEPAKAFAAIEREGVTHTAVVPAVAQGWLTHLDTHPASRPRSLEVLQVGGSRLADELAGRIRPGTGATLQQVFGMAEGLVCMTRLDDPDEVVCTTQGRPICDADEIRLVDEEGAPVPDGAPGALLTRGPYTPRGYYRAPDHNARSFGVDGWYASGDVVARRPDGNVVVHGRDKDIINRGGEKISAEEVETLAYRLEGVEMVAAVSMPDPVLGERLCLCATLRPGATLTLDEVREHMQAMGIAAFKLPEYLVLVDRLPLTTVGKIDKKALRDHVATLAGDA